MTGSGAAVGKPFYAYVPYTLVHYPTLPSKAFQGKTGNGDWADCLAQIDFNVGRLLDTIDELGLRDDTIAIFTSDNGPDASRPPSVFTTPGSGGPWIGAMFTATEANNRVPFVIRWPGHVPADRESNEMVHEADTFTTLARLAGAEVPQDRPIDGLDLSDFLLGTSDQSAREGFPIFFGEKLYGAKWRNFKLLFVHQEDATKPLETLTVPLIFDLLTNQKEDPALGLATTHIWVIMAVSKMIRDYQASFAKHPPIKAGTLDPYQPPLAP